MIPSPLLHTAFYKFTPLADPEAVVVQLRQLAAGLLGSILVAHEGINGVLAGPAAAVNAFERALVDTAFLGGPFAGISFKRSACSTPPFGRLKVHHKAEIVAVGLPAEAVMSEDGGRAHDGTLVSPQAWRELIQQDDVVLLDNRNSFEYRLGHFHGAVDPEVVHFKDFPRYVEAHAAQWKAEHKRVAMYCTGGIRCEKTGAWMQGLGLDVLQLEGGILNYFQAMPDAAQDWAGECFVFDNRIALDTQLQETGTTLEQVYQGEPDGEWRLQRARRLQASVAQAAVVEAAVVEAAPVANTAMDPLATAASGEPAA